MSTISTDSGANQAASDDESSSPQTSRWGRLRRFQSHSFRLPAVFGSKRVPVWWFEVVLIVVFDMAYEHVRDMVKLDPVKAINHGVEVLRISEWVHIDYEHTFNEILFNNHWLATIADYDYSFLHLPLTAGVLVWVFWKHRDRYIRIRNVLMITTTLALIGFWLYPVAPPRLLPGDSFVDIVVWFHTPFALASPQMAAATNEFAAMPSLHCAWALWSGLTLLFLSRNRWVRAFGALYPLWTIFVVLGTANHYLLDCIAGYACVGVSALIVSQFGKRSPWRAPLASVGEPVNEPVEPAETAL